MQRGLLTFVTCACVFFFGLRVAAKCGQFRGGGNKNTGCTIKKNIYLACACANVLIKLCFVFDVLLYLRSKCIQNT